MKLGLNWELNVLSRAIAFQNLSGAASHIGMSQPQLSRIISKLESEYGVMLLDRSSKRKSSWTAKAQKLVELYSELSDQFRIQVDQIAESKPMTTLRIATLEGLIHEAVEFASSLFKDGTCKTIELIVGDLGMIEERYFQGSIEFLLTSREPGKRKLVRSQIIGFQTLDLIETNARIQVLSLFEYSTLPKKHLIDPDKKRFVSNSLHARKEWLEREGGYGFIPSPLKRKSTKNASHVPVYLIGLDHLTDVLWRSSAGLLLAKK
ncbi:MAG: LysR family transcriptional regulator [Proteobacteria bacterium]|nr:LysR family transcriptional regulator [Pseudomonadota bacterium]